MAGIAVLVIAFIVASIGFIQSNRAIATKKYFGLTRTGIALVSLSALGLIFGIYDQVQQTRTIDKIAAAVGVAADDLQESSPGAASALRVVQRELDLKRSNLVAASFRESIVSAADFSYARVDNTRFVAADLSKSDFSLARLDGSLFSEASLRNAIFHDADFEKANFSGVDLSGITFDERTVFPDAR